MKYNISEMNFPLSDAIIGEVLGIIIFFICVFTISNLGFLGLVLFSFLGVIFGLLIGLFIEIQKIKRKEKTDNEKQKTKTQE